MLCSSNSIPFRLLERTIATASFSNASPTIRMFRVRSTSITWNNEMTDTGSVAEISTENATRSVYSKSIVSTREYAMVPAKIMSADINVPTIAYVRILNRLRVNA